MQNQPQKRNEEIIKNMRNKIRGAEEFFRAFRSDIRCQRREERRRFAVKFIAGLFALVSILCSTFVFIDPFEVIFDKWGIGRSFSIIIRLILAFGFPILIWIAFLWLSDKTGLHYLIQDWVVSWNTSDAQQSHNTQKYRSFPRRKRRALISDLKKELDEITDPLYRFELEADETEDEKLSESVESLNQVIGAFVTEVDISSRSLFYQPEHASWKNFVMATEETSKDLEMELKDIVKYHKDVQPLLKHASKIISQVVSEIVDYSGEKKEGTIIKA